MDVLDPSARQYVVGVAHYPANRQQIADRFRESPDDDPANIAAAKHFMEYTLRIRQQRGLKTDISQEQIIDLTKTFLQLIH